MCGPLAVVALAVGASAIGGAAVAAAMSGDTGADLPANPRKASIPADITDQAARARENSYNQSNLFGGSRRASALTGTLGDRSQIPTLQKSILGE